MQLGNGQCHRKSKTISGMIAVGPDGDRISVLFGQQSGHVPVCRVGVVKLSHQGIENIIPSELYALPMRGFWNVTVVEIGDEHAYDVWHGTSDTAYIW